jgi:hypothetical protein
LPPTDEKSGPVLVLYDGHKSHISLGLIEWAKNNNIVLFVLPPHCSHLLQPLDVGCFGPFEVAWNSACHSFPRVSGGKVITRYDVCRIACKIYASTLTPVNIQSSFRKCGIYPFDPTVIDESLLAPSLAFPKVVPTSTLAPSQSTSTTPPLESTSTTPPLESTSTTPTPKLTSTTPPSQPPSTTPPSQPPSTTPPSQPPSTSAPVLFLENKGGEVLRNVRVAKTRNTLSKVVGGKAIAEDAVTDKIKEHIENQGVKRKSTCTAEKTEKEPTNKSKKGNSKSAKGKGKAPATVHHDISDSDSDTTDREDPDRYCMCGKLDTPKRKIANKILKLVSWGQCDICDRWVHLGFCDSVRVLRRGDPFLCPYCKTTQ